MFGSTIAKQGKHPRNTGKLSRAFFKDFPVGGAFFEKGPFCEIIY
jgi:hypothetical protein